MGDGWIGLMGVGVGAAITGGVTILGNFLTRAERRREDRLQRIRELLSAVADLEAAVQDWVAYATLFKGDSRHLEQAGLAAGRLGLHALRCHAYAAGLDSAPTEQAVNELTDAARALTRTPLPGPGEERPVEVSYLHKRDEVVKALGSAIRDVRS